MIFLSVKLVFIYWKYIVKKSQVKVFCMNNISDFMNKIDIRSVGDTGLVLESLGVVTLGAFWDGNMLSGDYWRFYYHDRAGAGVVVRGRKKEFAAGRAYLLPPACNLESFCTGTPEQFFIHAELTGFRAAAAENIIALPEGFETERIDFLRRKLLAGEATDSAVRLSAIILIVQALAALPQSELTAPERDQRVTAVRDYINTRLNEDLFLDDLARRSGMSAAGFLRLFKRECGMTPYQYLLQQRYNCAAKLLKNSNLPIESICDAVGIKDRFHFSRQFKRIFGIPPAAYRECYCRK